MIGPGCSVDLVLKQPELFLNLSVSSLNCKFLEGRTPVCSSLHPTLLPQHSPWYRMVWVLFQSSLIGWSNPQSTTS